MVRDWAGGGEGNHVAWRDGGGGEARGEGTSEEGESETGEQS